VSIFATFRGSSGILSSYFQRILKDPFQQLPEDPQGCFWATFRGSSEDLQRSSQDSIQYITGFLS
jgi:hypothetical protein